MGKDRPLPTPAVSKAGLKVKIQLLISNWKRKQRVPSLTSPPHTHTHIHTHARTHSSPAPSLRAAPRAALSPSRIPGRPQPLSSSARWERPRAPGPSSPAARARGKAPGPRARLLCSWSSADGRCWKFEKPSVEPKPGRPQQRASPMTAPRALPRSGLRSAGAGG